VVTEWVLPNSREIGTLLHRTENVPQVRNVKIVLDPFPKSSLDSTHFGLSREVYGTVRTFADTLARFVIQKRCVAATQAS
jgi:hypothetical protein